MAITTLTELQTALADRLARSDFTTSQQNECIALAEAEMQRTLRTTDMETKNVSFLIQNEFENVPADFLEARSFWVTDDTRRALKYMSDDAQMMLYPTTGTDSVKFYSLVGKQFHFAPPPSGSARGTLTYYAKITPLSASVPSNWLLANWPDAYLYGALKHGAIRLKDPQAADIYGQIFTQALTDIQRLSNRARAGSGMAARPV